MEEDKDRLKELEELMDKTLADTGSLTIANNGVTVNTQSFLLNACGGAGSWGNIDSTMFRHAYEKGIIDYINNQVDEEIVSKEKLRKLKLTQL
jgi:hypothetical protein